MSSTELLDLRDDLAARQRRLLLLVGAGTDRLAGDLARSWDQPVTSIGQRLPALEPGARPDLSAILTGSVFADIDALFWSPTFNPEVLTLLRGIARRQPAAFVWPGVVESGVASYSEPGRRDHYEATLECEHGGRMTSHLPAAYFALVEGSPQAAENPPHDARWRLAIAARMRGFRLGVTEIGLDFELEPDRLRIDLDNMVRLALDGLRDAGVVARGVVGVERIVATKRPRTVPGLGISLAWNAIAVDDDPFGGAADLVAMSDTVPREESPPDKLAWRDAVTGAWSRPPVTKAVGVDITVTKTTSLAAMLKPVIDGLEAYLGREPLGHGTLRPRDEQVTWLRISRVPVLPVGLRVRAGDAPQPGTGRTIPPVPPLPEMDPDFTWSTSDLEAIDRYRAWHRTFAPGSGLFG